MCWVTLETGTTYWDPRRAETLVRIATGGQEFIKLPDIFVRASSIVAVLDNTEDDAE